MNGIGVNLYANSCLTSAQNQSETTSKASFMGVIQKVYGSDNSAGSSNAKYEGDVVIPQPPAYNRVAFNNTISSKSKDEMTMDEYKQWFVNEVSNMPVSTWYRSTCVGGALTITDSAFEKMKRDPEWENTVLNMIRKMYSVNGIMGSKMIGFQVIGASPEECYGEGIPVDNNSGMTFNSDSEESWWKKRHERMEELMKEQEKMTAIKRVYARRSKATRTTKLGDGVEFFKSALKCVSAGNQKAMLCSDALMAYSSPKTGESVNIYKADNYSEDNPIYLLQGIDADGNAYEQEVDASKIDPNCCSYNELMVLNVETGHTSPSDYLHSVATRDKSGTTSFFEMSDYIKYAKAVMEDMKKLGSWEFYLSYDKWIQSLLNYASMR